MLRFLNFKENQKKIDKKRINEKVDNFSSGKDFIKYNHGRNTEDTKEIYNYMLSALFNIKQNLDENFDENKFYEEVLFK